MIQYVFRDDEPIRIKAASKADPQVFGEALDRITKEHGGRLTPDAVVETARSANHPLHAHFEWDDKVAAESYRLDQARSIIRMVRVVDDEANDGTARAFLSVSDNKGVAYRSITEVKSSAELQMAVLKQADRDLDAFMRRFRDMTDVCADVQSARKKVAEKRKSGSWTSVILSKSWKFRIQVVAAMQTALNAKPMSSTAGSASTAHHESISPMQSITRRNIAAYVDPRSCPHAISPRAMSPVESGVASIWS